MSQNVVESPSSAPPSAKKIEARHPITYSEWTKRRKPRLARIAQSLIAEATTLDTLTTSTLDGDQFADFVAENGTPTLLANLRFGNAATSGATELSLQGTTGQFAWVQNPPNAVSVEFQADPGGGPDSVVLSVGAGGGAVTLAPTENIPYYGNIRTVILQATMASGLGTGAAVTWDNVVITFYDADDVPQETDPITLSTTSSVLSIFIEVDAPDEMVRVTVAGTGSPGTLALSWGATTPTSNQLYGRIMVWADPD